MCVLRCLRMAPTKGQVLQRFKSFGFSWPAYQSMSQSWGWKRKAGRRWNAAINCRALKRDAPGFKSLLWNLARHSASQCLSAFPRDNLSTMASTPFGLPLPVFPYLFPLEGGVLWAWLLCAMSEWQGRGTTGKPVSSPDAHKRMWGFSSQSFENLCYCKSRNKETWW